MQAKDFYTYIANPQSLESSSVEELQKLVKDFPYFQSAHLLLSLASKKWDATAYQQSLKKTAIVASNRAHLFNLIHQLENEVAVKEVPREEIPLKKEESVQPEEKLTVKEEKTQELDILKAAEISVESQEITKEPEPQIEFEKEIQKQVVSSFVEKQILKTPDLHKQTAPVEQPESFNDWLSFLKKNNGQPYQEIKEQVKKSKAEAAEKQTEQKPVEEKQLSKKQKNKALIDRIIEKNPGLIRTREEQKFYTPDLKAKESLIENEHLVTETLARIYALQGNVNKAVRAYEILSLKYPQKSAYFASLIEKLKNNH